MGQGYRMEAVFSLLLRTFNHLHHLIRQPLGNKVRHHHHIRITPLRRFQSFCRFCQTGCQVCSAFKTLKQKAGHLLDAVRAEKIIMHLFSGKEHDMALPVIGHSDFDKMLWRSAH